MSGAFPNFLPQQEITSLHCIVIKYIAIKYQMSFAHTSSKVCGFVFAQTPC